MIEKQNTGKQEMTLADVRRRIKGLDDRTAKRMVCALVGHSKIQTFCFGYFTCGRCGEQVGDSLGSTYPGAETAVVIGHDCPRCRANSKRLTWKDTFKAPKPFPVTERAK